MDDKTREAITRYLRDVRALPHEAAKTHRFAGLVSELFPGTTATTEFVAGIEKLVRVEADAKSKRGWIDAYHGNAVIEFENSLKATEEEAKRQLRAYTAGLWAKQGKAPRPLVCIATDGLVWKTFRPTLVPGVRGKPTEDHVQLELLRVLILSEQAYREFWIWVTSLLFRPARTDPSPDNFRTDFGATSPAFADAMEALHRAWGAVGRTKEARLAFETWQKYLTVTYGNLGLATSPAITEEEGEEIPAEEAPVPAPAGSSELETLFFKHTYLASLARLLIWAALSRGRATSPLRDVAKEVLSGSYFAREKIENLVEDDFFKWVRRPKAEALLAPVWERTLAHMLTYDLSRLNQDILKGVYQELVDPKDRHDLGEYYTPQWLCERIVAEILPPKGFVRVLDPTCGSGSFLHAAISHMLRGNPTGGDATRLRQTLDSVVGIDIHPLAVTIARATYLFAVRDLIKATKRPIQVPVYLADSLFLPSEVRQLNLGSGAVYEIRFGRDRRVAVPDAIVEAPDAFDPAIAACAKIAADHADKGKESETALRAYLTRAVPELASRSDFRTLVAAAEIRRLARERYGGSVEEKAPEEPSGQLEAGRQGDQKEEAEWV